VLKCIERGAGPLRLDRSERDDARQAGTARDWLVDVAQSRIAVLMGDLTILRPLGAAGINAYVVTTDPRDPTLRSRYAAGARVVTGFTAEAVRPLCRLGEDLLLRRGVKTPLLFGTDAQLALVYAHEEQIRARYLFLANDAETGGALLDKERFAALARTAGIPTPRTATGRAVLDGELDGSVVVKPKRKTSWGVLKEALFDGRAKARAFASAKDLREDPAFVAHADELIVQERIAHAPDGLLSFHGFADERSRILASFVGRKIRTYPSDGGESSYIELAEDPNVATLGRRVVSALGLRGPFKIDVVRKRGTTKDLVLEVNARFTLWSYLGAVSGINLPAVACAYLERGEVPGTTLAPARGFRWLNSYRDYQAFRDDEVGLGEWLASMWPRRKIYETFAWSDPWPFASWCGQTLRAKVS
jgi:predicted ATP-grasp superfamily ATP-dependent carboligase